MINLHFNFKYYYLFYTLKLKHDYFCFNIDFFLISVVSHQKFFNNQTSNLIFIY
jgi:hypothetical protein